MASVDGVFLWEDSVPSPVVQWEVYRVQRRGVVRGVMRSVHPLSFSNVRHQLIDPAFVLHYLPSTWPGNNIPNRRYA